ncbi:bifunctional phosphoribosylaminoimidazolecarboxamide formyltransferase/IMP cyclohydrolase [bacterium]|nr:bifunctional phosphoribosylaminoimidazolecarboxamide formyltransferase/IMP cyclohydrolase [bacterium]
MGIKIEKALISVWFKDDLEELAKILNVAGVRIYSTGGTARFLNDNGINVVKVEELTGFEQILGGRVKTLHPKLFGGILARKQVEKDFEELKNMGIPKFDMVVCNLYPFADAVLEGKKSDELLEMIDIGGVSLLRAAGKNYKNVVVVPDPKFYPEICKQISANGEISEEFSHSMAKYTFSYTSYYDAIIANSITPESEMGDFPEFFNPPLKKSYELRYGENPHQRGALYEKFGKEIGLPQAKVLWGKELSYNNINDLEGVLAGLKEFEEPCSVVVKHNSPCGIAIDDDLIEAYQNALHSDHLSAFGGLVGFNRPVTAELAELLNQHFFECVLAPEFTDEAFEILKAKKNRRLIRIDLRDTGKSYVGKYIQGGLLLQDDDPIGFTATDFKCVTKRQPTDAEMEMMKFAWRAIKYIKSNSVLVAQRGKTVGIGGGMPSRVDAAIMATRKAGNKAKGAVASSDAFLPFPDTLQVLADAGVTALIQPGGSRNDNLSIELADKLNVTMIFTGVRHFRH